MNVFCPKSKDSIKIAILAYCEEITLLRNLSFLRDQKVTIFGQMECIHEIDEQKTMAAIFKIPIG